MSDLVSIALCTYNGANHLRQQIETLIHQTYPVLEIVISDDASTDDSASVIEHYRQKDSRIKVILNDQNIGYIKNFEKTIKACTGSFIAPCDQDDIWKPDKIEILLNNIGDHELIYHDSDFVNEELQSLNKKVSDIKRFYRGADSRHFLLENCVSGHACMFRSGLREIIFPFPDVQYHDWWIALAACGISSIGFVSDSLVLYRQHHYSHTDILSIKSENLNQNKISFQRRQNLLNAAAFRENKQYEFCREFARLHQASAETYLNFKLFFLVYANRRVLFYIRKKAKSSIFFEILKFLWGEKLKRLFT